MAYSKFTLATVVKQFALSVDYNANLFPTVAPIAPSASLETTLAEYIPLALAIGTEKARSELIVTPILTEIRRNSPTPIAFFSGINFDADPEQGLAGYCDYLLARSEQQYFVEAPVLAVVEAKNDDIKNGLGQCVATMIGAQLFNEQSDVPPRAIYGVVTTGSLWRFLRLSGSALQINGDEEFLSPVERLLGILTAIVSDAPDQAADAPLNTRS